MGDNGNARLARALQRLLDQKSQPSTLSTVLDDIFPVYLLDELSAPENSYQQSRDFFFGIANAPVNAADRSAVQLLNSSPGSLVVIEGLLVATSLASSVEFTTGGLFAGSALAATGNTWRDERNNGAGPPALQQWATNTAGVPASAGIPTLAGTPLFIPGPWVLRPSNPASAALRLRSTIVNCSLTVMQWGYERPWDPTDA